MVYELQGTNIDWEYKALRSRRHSLTSVEGVSWPRGLALGGSGAIGTMKYELGNPRNYDVWKQLGNIGWGSKDVAAYFDKSIRHSDSDKLHNTTGFLSVDNYEAREPMNRLFVKAVKELGFEHLRSLNEDRNLGVAWAQFMIENGTRCSSAKAFLNPVKYRKNLHIIKHAYVTSISLTNDIRPLAQGVNFILRNKHNLRAKARKEIVVSAGAVNTPKLLLLSGIGRKSDLEPFNITHRADLSVGYNLQDHVAIPLFFKFTKSSRRTINFNLEKVLNLFDFALKTRSQPITYHHMTGLTLNMNTLNSSESFPDAQAVYQLFKKGGFTSYLVLWKIGYDLEMVKSVYQAEQEAHVVMAMISVLEPKSRGTIKLVASDPYRDPAIKPSYLSEYEDLKTLVRAIRIHQQMLTTNSFLKSGVQLYRLNIPACAFILYNSDEYWECYIRHVSTSMYHPAGTAKMGPDNDSEAVVDSRLRVRNVRNLRIVDASIMPTIVGAGLMAPTIMIGEKGAEMLKQDHRM